MDHVVAALRAAWAVAKDDSSRETLIRISMDRLDRLPLIADQQQQITSTPEFSPLMPSLPSQQPPPVAVPDRRTTVSPGLNVNAFKAAAATTTRTSYRYDEEEEEDYSRKRFQQQQPTFSAATQANNPVPSFTTAKSRLLTQQPNYANNQVNNNNPYPRNEEPSNGGGGPKPFKPPLLRPPAAAPTSSRNNNNRPSFNVKDSIQRHNQQQNDAPPPPPTEDDVHPRLKGIDPELIERIENDILESGETVTFDDIAGLEFAKQCIEEMVVWPMKNPELYTGLRQMPRGVLLFGPPGNGKTIIGKAIAHECNATFFSISASSLTSKWIGEGEKMVRALFAVAAVRQPSVVFIDEIDSLLTQRSAEENEASRRIKTEFLIQFDGASTKQSDLILVIGATNRPQELDEAARRRFVRRLYIPLPDDATRTKLLQHLLTKNEHTLTVQEIQALGQLTAGYSGADTTNLAREASMGPLRDVMRNRSGASKELRPITRKDFDSALRSVKASVSLKDLSLFEKWNEEFGTQQMTE